MYSNYFQRYACNVRFSETIRCFRGRGFKAPHGEIAVRWPCVAESGDPMDSDGIAGYENAEKSGHDVLKSVRILPF